MKSAIVVGSGPNGLAGAVRLAQAGLDVTVLEAAPTIGGGTRSSEQLVPGLIHDHCSAFHPVAAASPFLNELDLRSRGLEWLTPAVDCVHPLDDGSAGVLHRSIERTADGLGEDGKRWQRLFRTLTTDFHDLFADASQPVLSIPARPVLLARFGVAAALPATMLGRLWKQDQTRALFAGAAAHTLHPLDRPLSSAIGLTILAAGHVHGWVVAKGGSQAIADALRTTLEERGGQIITDCCVTSFFELAPADIVLLDLAPSAAARVLGDRLPNRVRRAFQRFHHGPGAFKVDFAIDGDVPWSALAAREAGTVHLGGSFEEVVATERLIHQGAMPDKPFVLVGQQYLADPSRSAGSVNPLWTYAHVPHGYSGDATAAIVDQIERFAPGFREQIVGTAVRSTTEMSAYNQNFVGGDIIGGSSSPTQLLFRPRLTPNPYFTGVPGVYLCSASTPPGAGAHGMCGVNAANRALSELGAL